jgi:hypothetical protein
VVLCWRGLKSLGSSYGWTRWTQRFMWFMLLECNTLRPQERWVLYCCVVARVYVELARSECEDSNACPAFYSMRALQSHWDQSLTGGPGLVASLHENTLLARSSKWYLQRRGEYPILLSRHVAPMHNRALCCCVAQHSSGSTTLYCSVTRHCRDTQ